MTTSHHSSFMPRVQAVNARMATVPHAVSTAKAAAERRYRLGAPPMRVICSHSGQLAASTRYSDRRTTTCCADSGVVIQPSSRRNAPRKRPLTAGLADDTSGTEAEEAEAMEAREDMPPSWNLPLKPS